MCVYVEQQQRNARSWRIIQGLTFARLLIHHLACGEHTRRCIHSESASHAAQYRVSPYPSADHKQRQAALRLTRTRMTLAYYGSRRGGHSTHP